MICASATPVSQRLIVLHPSGRRRSADSVVEDAPSQEAQPLPDVDAIREDGRREGHAAGRREAMLELEHQKHCLEIKQHEEIQRLVDQRSDELAQHLAALIENARGTLAANLATALRPLLERLLRQEAIDTLLGELDKIARENLPGMITVSGNDGMLAKCAARLQERGIEVRREAFDGEDVKITLDHLVFETRIGEWLETIEAIL